MRKNTRKKQYIKWRSPRKTPKYEVDVLVVYEYWLGTIEKPTNPKHIHFAVEQMTYDPHIGCFYNNKYDEPWEPNSIKAWCYLPKPPNSHW